MSAPSSIGRREIGRRKGVVDQQRNPGVVRDLRHRRDVEHFEPGIADGFGDHEPRVRLDRGAEAVEVARLDKGRGDAEARQRVREQIDGAAIERGGGDDVVAGVEQRGDGQMQRRHAAGGADRADAGFQRGDPLLQHRHRRIGDARVDVSGALQVEQRRGVVGVLEHVGRRLVDRHRARPRDGIGALAGMQAQGFEGRRLGCGHAALIGGELERGRSDVHGGAHAAGISEHAQVSLDFGGNAGRLLRVVGQFHRRPSVDRSHLADDRDRIEIGGTIGGAADEIIGEVGAPAKADADAPGKMPVRLLDRADIHRVGEHQEASPWDRGPSASTI